MMTNYNSWYGLGKDCTLLSIGGTAGKSQSKDNSLSNNNKNNSA